MIKIDQQAFHEIEPTRIQVILVLDVTVIMILVVIIPIFMSMCFVSVALMFVGRMGHQIVRKAQRVGK